MGEYQRALEENGRENFSKTLRALFQRAAPTGWDADHTNSVTPDFLSDEDMTSAQVYTSGADGILFEEGNSRWRNTALDDSQGDRETDVIITIFSANKYLRMLFQEEVERILRQNRPGQGTIVLKSNGTDDSAITGWSFPLPDWTAFELGLNKPERSAKIQTILQVFWQANWVTS